MSEQAQGQVSQEQLEMLEGFGQRFMELKAYFLKLNLVSHENVRICIERLDDGFLRGREAIFSMPIVQEYADETPANDSALSDEIPLAATGE